MVIEDLARKLWETHFENTDPAHWEHVTLGQKEQYVRMAAKVAEVFGPKNQNGWEQMGHLPTCSFWFDDEACSCRWRGLPQTAGTLAGYIAKLEEIVYGENQHAL